MNIQKMEERRKAYVEVLEVLKHMEPKYVAQIPEELMKFFWYHCDQNYHFQIDPAKPLDQNEFKEQTITILAMLNLNYWCETEEHRQELLQQYKENQRVYDEEIRKKYSPEDLFKNRKKQEIKFEMNEELLFPQEQQEIKWYQKIKKWITQILDKIKRE